MKSRTVVHLGIAFAVFVLFFLHLARLMPITLLDQIERSAYDARVLLTMPQTKDRQVVIVDIDEKSIAAEGQWPWPRDKLAKLTDQLFTKYKINTVGFDVVFPERDRRSGAETLAQLAQGPLADLPGFAERAALLAPSLDFDRIFGDSLQRRSVVLGFVFKDAESIGASDSIGALPPPLVDRKALALTDVKFYENKAYTANLPILQEQAIGGGYFDNSLGIDDDGVFRRVPMVQSFNGALYGALSLEVVRRALGAPPLEFEFDPPESRASANLEAIRIGKVRIPVDEHVAAFVPYRGRWPSFDYISATDVINGTAAVDRLSGKLVLLGTTAPGLLDLRITPVGQAYPGVEVHANLISGMLDGRIKHKAPYYVGIHAVMLLLITLALGIASARMAPLGVGAIVLGIILVIVGLAFLLWTGANFIVPMGTPIAFTALLFLVLTFYGYFVESRSKREMSKLFGEYIPPELVEEMAANPQTVTMEGEKRTMTVLFSDVRGFTTISENLDSKELSALMNQFLTPLTKVIQQHRGTIDKYMGDAIMAFWGAPLRDENHATNALKAGLAMNDAVRSLDADFAAKGWPALNIGVGINTGDMTVGNMGSEFRRAYTVLGDAVNLGSRLESLTKEYGVFFICSEATRNAGPSDWSYRELDMVRVKGKSIPVAIYEPLGPKDHISPTIRQDLARHRGALKLYRAQLWDQAEAELFSLSRSGRPHKVYDLFLERIQFLRNNPPGANWDGAFTFTHK